MCDFENMPWKHIVMLCNDHWRQSQAKGFYAYIRSGIVLHGLKQRYVPSCRFGSTYDLKLTTIKSCFIPSIVIEYDNICVKHAVRK